MEEIQKAESTTEEIDENVDGELLEVLGRHEDFEAQQQQIERIATSVAEITVARRLYTVLFPIAAGVNRRAG